MRLRGYDGYTLGVRRDVGHSPNLVQSWELYGFSLLFLIFFLRTIFKVTAQIFAAVSLIIR